MIIDMVDLYSVDFTIKLFYYVRNIFFEREITFKEEVFF